MGDIMKKYMILMVMSSLMSMLQNIKQFKLLMLW